MLRKSKIISALIIILVLAFLIPTVTFSHSGGTDSKGGHYNGNDYHYHHGYPAHDHEDLDGDGKLDCPYDFKDKTNSSSSSNTDSKQNDGAKSNTKTEPGKAKKTFVDIVLMIIDYLLVFAIIAFGGSAILGYFLSLIGMIWDPIKKIGETLYEAAPMFLFITVLIMVLKFFVWLLTMLWFRIVVLVVIAVIVIFSITKKLLCVK